MLSQEISYCTTQVFRKIREVEDEMFNNLERSPEKAGTLKIEVRVQYINTQNIYDKVYFIKGKGRSQF